MPNLTHFLEDRRNTNQMYVQGYDREPRFDMGIWNSPKSRKTIENYVKGVQLETVSGHDLVNYLGYIPTYLLENG